MKLLEAQAKALLSKRGIPCPQGGVALTVIQSQNLVQELGFPVMVKAQVPTGGRGKAGGIKLCLDNHTLKKHTKNILDMSIGGYPVSKVLIEEALSIKKEYYLSVLFDQVSSSYLFMASADGGMDVEDMAHEVKKIRVHPLLGPSAYHARYLAPPGLTPILMQQWEGIVKGIWDVVRKYEAILVEINPLVLDEEKGLIAADAKVEIDGNSLFRQKDFQGHAQEGHPLEQLAAKWGLAYVKLQGDIGVIGNGAGLVMATLDNLRSLGGKPANFLDIGGGAKAETVEKALKIVSADPEVKVIFMNIFGGITRCDEVAKGIISGAKGIELPMVIRLAGTKHQEGLALLKQRGFITAQDFSTASTLVVKEAESSGYLVG